MRILLGSNVYPPNFIGGAELIAHQQAKALQAMGHEVEVFAGETHPFGSHHEMRTDVWEGIRVHRISMLPVDFEPDFVNFSHRDIDARFGDVLARFRPEVFHAHNLIGLSAALPHLARRAGAATVVTLHDHWGYCFKNTIIKEGSRVCQDFSRCAECKPVINDGADRAIPIRFRKDFIRLMLSEVDAFVSPSQYLALSYETAGFPRDRVHVVWNGIDVTRFDHVARVPFAGELRLTFVGILAPHKGVSTLMEALGHLPERACVRVNLVGAGDAAPYEEILARNGRRAWVRFWGRLDHSRVAEAYADTDVLVLPSVWPENQPVSITEAMACRIPAIVSNMGGMLELVRDGASGDVFEAGNAESLAAKIRYYLDDPGRAARLGEAARARIEGHTFERQVEHLTRIYLQARESPRELRVPRFAACVGRRVGTPTAQAAEVLGGEHGWHFVMREWLTPEWAARARLTWVSDAEAPLDAAATGPENRPMIVDVRHRGARRAGSSSRALFFHDSAQALRVVQELDADEAVWADLGRRVDEEVGETGS